MLIQFDRNFYLSAQRRRSCNVLRKSPKALGNNEAGGGIFPPSPARGIGRAANQDGKQVVLSKLSHFGLLSFVDATDDSAFSFEMIAGRHLAYCAGVFSPSDVRVAFVTIRRRARVSCIAHCVVTSLTKAAMTRVLHDEPEFSDLFLTYLLTRNSRIEEDLIDQLFNSSEKRLARTLLLLANFGKDGGPQPIDAKFSQATLAEMIGTTRSRVSFS